MPTTDSRVAADTPLIRQILTRHGRFPGSIEQIPDDGDLYSAGLTSLGTVGVMLAIEEAFEIEFPESKLQRSTFRSIETIAGMARENNEVVEQTAAAAQRLEHLAANLQETVSRFKT